jgi:hypothetical protein
MVSDRSESDEYELESAHWIMASSNSCRRPVKMLIGKSLEWVAHEIEIQGELLILSPAPHVPI